MRDCRTATNALFYSLHGLNPVEELLPIVYTPPWARDAKRFSEIWRKARLFISYTNRDAATRSSPTRYERSDCTVVSDGERIIGIGDQGAGGMGISHRQNGLLHTALGASPHAPNAPIPDRRGHCKPGLPRITTSNYGWKIPRSRPRVRRFMRISFSAVADAADQDPLQSGRTLPEGKRRRETGGKPCALLRPLPATASAHSTTTSRHPRPSHRTLLAAVHATGVPFKDQRIAISAPDRRE